MSQPKKYLRGDPDRPFLSDIAEAEKLLKQFTHPTHEPLWFYRIRGTCSPADVARSKNYKKAENIEVMEKLGLQMLDRAEFFKGIGLVRERKQMDQIVQLAKEIHKRGLMISVYVGGTMFTEYFFKEVPKAIEWSRKAQDGGPVTYGGKQLNRWFPCLNHPDYRAYMKKVLDVAVDEVQADEIFFDNQILRHEPRSCRCDYCIQHVRQMVREKYTLAQCEERYGVAEYPDTMPPVWSQANPPWLMDRIHNTSIQDWIDHRVKTVLDFYQDMANHVKAKSPTTCVGMNIKGIHGDNRAFDYGICHGAAADILDFSCIDGYKPGFRNGGVSSEVRFFKASHSTHMSVVDGDSPEIVAVEAMVYGYRKKIEGHGWIGGIEACTELSPALQFMRANQRLYHERQRVWDVAVLRYEPATNYNCAKTHEQLIPFEQTLATEKLPWGIIFDRQKDSLSNYRVIALPEIQALSDVWLDKLDAFMKAGGGVIASGEAAGFNEWMRPRTPNHALARWLGHAPEGRYERACIGKGRFVYVPTWDVHQRWDFKDWCSMGLGSLPVKDRALFQRVINDASADVPLSFRAEGNDAVYLEGIVPDAGRKSGVDLHFINYNAADQKPVMPVRVALPTGMSGAQVELIHSDVLGYPKETAHVVIEGREALFQMLTPRVYGIALVRFQ